MESKINSIEHTLQNGILSKERKNFPHAAGLFTDAIIQSQEANYSHGMLHGLFNIGTIWRLKARETGSADFSRLARLSFLEAVDFAKAHDMPRDEVVQAKFLLGQSELDVRNFPDAIALLQETYEYYREHPRSKAHTGDVERHLGTAYVQSGHTEKGIALLKEGLTAIRIYDEKDAFDKRNYVWETGALLALSDAYAASNKTKAKQFAQDALTIATNNDLVIRKEEAEKTLKNLQ